MKNINTIFLYSYTLILVFCIHVGLTTIGLAKAFSDLDGILASTLPTLGLVASIFLHYKLKSKPKSSSQTTFIIITTLNYLLLAVAIFVYAAGGNDHGGLLLLSILTIMGVVMFGSLVTGFVAMKGNSQDK